MSSATETQVVFWIVFAALTILIVYCNQKYCLLKDISKAGKQPYSWARVQLAWWTIIVLSSFITILYEHHNAPELDISTVILIGISTATIATARVIDVSEEQEKDRHQDGNGENFLLDIISDQNGASIHRLQTVIFNAAFGVYFITEVINNLPTHAHDINHIMPIIAQNNLVLLGLSSATYAFMKTTENKTPATAKAEQAPAAAADDNLEDQPVG